MVRGSMLHTAFLEPDRFDEQFVHSQFDNYRTKAAREWRDEVIASGKQILSDDDTDFLQGALASLRSVGADTLLEGHVEASLVWRHERTGLWLKSRPDILPVSGMAVDLKTTNDASGVACYRSVNNFRYDVQLALVSMGMEAIFGVSTSDAALLFIETSEPYLTRMVDLPQPQIEEAIPEIEAALDAIASGIETGDWPTYNDSTWLRPDWL